MWFLFGEVSSSSGCLGWGTLFYCGTPCAFHIVISNCITDDMQTCNIDGLMLVGLLYVYTVYSVFPCIFVLILAHLGQRLSGELIG